LDGSPVDAGRAGSSPAASWSGRSVMARLAALYGSPVSAMRCRTAAFRALSRVMLHLFRRVGPRLPATVSGMTNEAPESVTLVLVAAAARAGWRLGSGQAVRCHCLERNRANPRAPGSSLRLRCKKILGRPTKFASRPDTCRERRIRSDHHAALRTHP
jgi:hypothetical protein